MALSTWPLTEGELGQGLVNELNRTSKALVNRSMWSLPLLRRLFYRRTEIGVPELLHVCTSIHRGKTYFCLLVNFRDVVMGNPDQYGWDLAGRWLFYDVDLLDTPPFKAVKKSIESRATKTEVSYGQAFLPYEKSDEEYVKSLKGNYKPHIFGEKSKQYRVLSYFGLAAVAPFAQALMCFGIQRAERFMAEGQNDVLPELYDLPLQLAGLGNVSNTRIGCVTIEVEGTMVGAISMYAQGALGDADMLYLHEILIDPDPKWKSLSLATLLHIHAVLYYRRSLQKDIVFNLGYNFADGYQGYKDVFRPNANAFNVYTEMDTEPGVPLSCFKG
ncbi:hypothetical protein Illi2_00187 [Pseudomonas phage vB_PpuM-Illi-2]